jgi:hypothetical protein
LPVAAIMAAPLFAGSGAAAERTVPLPKMNDVAAESPKNVSHGDYQAGDPITRLKSMGAGSRCEANRLASDVEATRRLVARGVEEAVLGRN